MFKLAGFGARWNNPASTAQNTSQQKKPYRFCKSVRLFCRFTGVCQTRSSSPDGMACCLDGGCTPVYADGVRLVQVYHRRVRAARRRLGGLRLPSARRRSLVWSNTERLPLRDVLFYILYKAEMIERTDRVWYTDDKRGSKQEKVWRINHVYLPRKYHCQFFGTKRKTV